MMRSGVHGSSRPGLIITGTFSGMAGIQIEFTPGELLGRTTPNASVSAK